MEEDLVNSTNSTKQDEPQKNGFVESFALQLEKEKNRLTSEPSETAAARHIRDIVSSANPDFKAKLEPYYAHPLLGRRSFFFLAIWTFICDIIFFASFQKNDITAILLTLFTLMVFVVGVVIIMAMFLGMDTFNKLLPKKACYNVETEFTTPYRYSIQTTDNVEPNQTIVLCANHDSLPGTYFEDKGLFRKIAMIYTPFFMLFFVLICIIKMGIGIDTTAKIVGLTLVPGLLSLFAIFIFIASYSLFPTHARENNCIAPSIALAVFATLYGQKNYLPENTRFIYVSFGGENSGHGGSKAFIERHLARDRGFNKAKVVCLEEIKSSSLVVPETDIFRRCKYDDSMLSALKSNAQTLEIELAKERDALASMHGHIASSFAKQNIQAISILGKKYSDDNPHPIDSENIQKLFTLTLETVKGILSKDNN